MCGRKWRLDGRADLTLVVHAWVILLYCHKFYESYEGEERFSLSSDLFFK